MDQRSLEELEGVIWGEPEFPSTLVLTCHRLRKKPLRDLSVEELRLLIGQQIGLPFLLPGSLTLLKQNPLVEGDFYPGDLLRSHLQIDPSYLTRETDLLRRLITICRQVLAACGPEASLRQEVHAFLERFAVNSAAAKSDNGLP